MKYHLANIEPMEALLAFMYDWLVQKDKAELAAYYFSVGRQKNVLLRINDKGEFVHDYFQEMFLHKTLKRSTVRSGCITENISSFHNQFADKFVTEQSSNANQPVYIFSFLNAGDNKRDMLFVRLSQKKNNSKIASGGQILLDMPEEDRRYEGIATIAPLLYSQYADYWEQLLSFRNLYEHRCAELENAREENARIQEQLNHQRLEMARNEFDLLAEKYKREYVLDNHCIKKIAETDVNTVEFTNALRKAFLNAMALSDTEDKIEIKGEHLYFEAPTGTRKGGIEENTRVKKVEQYLNKLEAAALLVLKEDEKLTSENIGRKCDPRLIPAAISDYNKRHKERIHMLMINRPDDWPTIRDFRPIMNILTGFNPPEENRTLPALGL